MHADSKTGSQIQGLPLFGWRAAVQAHNTRRPIPLSPAPHPSWSRRPDCGPRRSRIGSGSMTSTKADGSPRHWLPSGRRPPTLPAKRVTDRKVLSARSATNVLIAPATRSARFGFARRSNARCGHSGQVSTPGGAKAKKPAKPSRIPSGKPSSRTRGLALPNSATPIGCRHDVPVPVSRATAALAPPQRRHQHPLHQRPRRSLCCARLRSGARKRRPPVRRCARRRRDRHHVFPLRHWPLRSRGGDLTQASGRRAGRRRALPLFPARQGELKCQRTKRKSFR